jgi:hypothetical protein
MIMRIPLKLNAIEQEHLQELYDAASAARDELPYTEKFDELWEGFQNRTFKNAEREQVYGAIMKYVRTGSPAGPMDSTEKRLTDDQAKQLKALLVKTVRGAKLLPYSDEFESLRKEFNKLIGSEFNERDFWQAIRQAQGPKRQPPRRAKVAAPKEEEVEEDGE